MASCIYILKLLLLVFYIIDISRSTNVISCLQTNCQDSTINCPNDGDDCFISCHDNSSCENTIINCPSNQECLILCHDNNSCKNTTFNGQYSSTLDITGCNKYQSCFDITIHCPSHSNPNDINCFIEGNDNLGSDITIYALNGWNDIDIDYNGTFNNNLHGTMYCNSDYSTSCIIASDKWECLNTNICNNTFIPITTTYINNTSNSVLNSDKHIEMIIIVSALIIALCFITFCCWYNNKNRKQMSTNTDSNTMKNIIANKPTKTNEDTEYYANKISKKGEKSKSKSKSINNNGYKHANQNSKSNPTISNPTKIINKHNIKHSGTHTHTHTHTTHSAKPNSMSNITAPSKSNSAISMEITTDIDYNKRNKINKYNKPTDINMVQRQHKTHKSQSSQQKYDKDKKHKNKNKKKQKRMQQQQNQQQPGAEQKNNKSNTEYIGNDNNNVNAINTDINNIAKRRKQKEITNIEVTEYKNSTEDQLEVINEQQAIPQNLKSNLKYGNKNNNNDGNREQLQFKSSQSDSDPMFIKSPDTWSNFEKENGILDDQYAINQMMGYLEEGNIACSYDE